MYCPYCHTELEHHDTFGLLCQHQSGEKHGDIYRCCNEEVECYGTYFYTYIGKEEELVEGYPC